jgi:serine/threonine protein kinase
MSRLVALFLLISTISYAADFFPKERFSPCRLLVSPIRSAVFLCYDKKLKAKVVVKLVCQHEIDMMNRVKGFKRSIQLLDSISAPEGIYAIVEFAGAGDLFRTMQNIRKLAAHEAIVRIQFFKAALAIAELHKNGIAHRDIKPENFFIFLDEEGIKQIKIGDFETAVSVGIRRKSTGRRGSLGFIAPEVLEGAEYDPLASDIYSAGMMLVSMLIGRPIQQERDLVVLVNGSKISSLLHTYKLSHDWPPELLDLLERMTAQDPKNRPTIEEVLDHPWLKGLEETE